MADCFKPRGKLLGRARRALNPDFILGSFGAVYEELVWDAQALGQIITYINSQSRKARGKDATLDRIRDILHEGDYTS
jgi:hypothetical protein